MSADTPILAEFLTPDELASELRISPRTLARWAAIGETPPATLVGRQRLYRRGAVRVWLEAREQHPT